MWARSWFSEVQVRSKRKNILERPVFLTRLPWFAQLNPLLTPTNICNGGPNLPSFCLTSTWIAPSNLEILFPNAASNQPLNLQSLFVREARRWYLWRKGLQISNKTFSHSRFSNASSVPWVQGFCLTVLRRKEALRRLLLQFRWLPTRYILLQLERDQTEDWPFRGVLQQEYPVLRIRSFGPDFFNISIEDLGWIRHVVVDISFKCLKAIVQESLDLFNVSTLQLPSSTHSYPLCQNSPYSRISLLKSAFESGNILSPALGLSHHLNWNAHATSSQWKNPPTPLHRNLPKGK